MFCILVYVKTYTYTYTWEINMSGVVVKAVADTSVKSITFFTAHLIQDVRGGSFNKFCILISAAN